jgi:hypothetical protein
MEPLSDKFDDPKQVKQIEQSLRDIHTYNQKAGGTLLTIYEVDSDGLLSHDEDLSNVILQAIVRLWLTKPSKDQAEHGTGMARSSPPDKSPCTVHLRAASTRHGATHGATGRTRRRDRAIQLAVRWDRPQVVASIFRATAAGGADFTSAHQLALQYALELRRASILELLLSYPGFSLTSVNLCRLFLHDGRYRFLAGDEALQSILIGKMQNIRMKPAVEQYGIFRDTIGDWLYRHVSRDLAYVVLDAEEPQFSHLVMWSLFLGEAELADLFWKECDEPARVALLGARQCQIMGERLLTAKTQVPSASPCAQMPWAACGGASAWVPSYTRRADRAMRLRGAPQQRASGLGFGPIRGYRPPPCCGSAGQLSRRHRTQPRQQLQLYLSPSPRAAPQAHAGGQRPKHMPAASNSTGRQAPLSINGNH